MTIAEALCYLAREEVVNVDHVYDILGTATLPRDPRVYDSIDTSDPRIRGLMLACLRDAAQDDTVFPLPRQSPAIDWDDQRSELAQGCYWRMSRLDRATGEILDYLIQSTDPRNQMDGVQIGHTEGDAIGLALVAFALQRKAQTEVQDG
jgi:hypothetical protein